MDRFENLCNDALICISTICDRGKSTAPSIRIEAINNVSAKVVSISRQMLRTEDLIRDLREHYKSNG